MIEQIPGWLPTNEELNKYKPEESLRDRRRKRKRVVREVAVPRAIEAPW